MRTGQISLSAAEINAEYRKARTSMVDSANHLLKVGQMLTDKKNELQHGEFIPWVEAGCDFSRQAAAKMMKAYANVNPTLHLTEDDALAISRQTWGNANGSVVDKYSGQDEWYTPKEYVEHVRGVLGEIDLDPASNKKANKTIKAGQIFSAKDNGLEREWPGRVFLNPPYKQPEIAQFTKKLVDDYRSGLVTDAILLTNNSTDTSWWQYAANTAAAICFTSGRISFYRDKTYNSPTNGQTFLYFGKDIKSFIKIFNDVGWVGYGRR